MSFSVREWFVEVVVCVSDCERVYVVLYDGGVGDFEDCDVGNEGIVNFVMFFRKYLFN